MPPIQVDMQIYLPIYRSPDITAMNTARKQPCPIQVIENLRTHKSMVIVRKCTRKHTSLMRTVRIT